MKERNAIIVFAFGLRGSDDPGISNEKLAEATSELQNKLHRGVPPVLVAQLEIQLCNSLIPIPDYVVRKHRFEGKYLDSEEVAKQTIEYLESLDAKTKWTIHVVAHPFLHRFKCVRLFPGYEVKAVKTGWVPFDKESIQWWTRGPIRLLWYTFRQIVFRYKGPATEELLKNKKDTV